MITVTAKTVDEAVTKALIELETTTTNWNMKWLIKEVQDSLVSAQNQPSFVLRKKSPLRIEDGFPVSDI